MCLTLVLLTLSINGHKPVGAFPNIDQDRHIDLIDVEILIRNEH